MNYRCLLTLLLFFAAPLTALAQKNFIVSLKAEPHLYPNRNFYIDSVVDLRLITSNIGMAQVGLNNRQVEAHFDQPFNQTMTSYFRATLPYQSGQMRIVAVINELRISEKTYKTKERGFADVDINFCRIDSGRLYTLSRIVKRVESGGLDVSAAHSRRLASALNECLNEFNGTDYGKNHGTHLESPTDWVNGDPERNILLCEDRLIGIYENFKQLRSNSPVSQDVRIEPRGILFMVRDSDSKARLREPFGICDGQSLYVNTYFYNAVAGKGLFAKVIEEGRILAWFDHYMSGTEAGLVSGAFGVVGNTIAASDVDIISLDLKTGVIKPVKVKFLEELLSEDPPLLKQYRERRNRGDVTVMMEFVKLFNGRNKL